MEIQIHNWENTNDYEVYIGESNNVFQRTRQHYETGAVDASSWQNKLQKNAASLYIIGHKHFNKSMTLDVENRLMQYMLSVNGLYIYAYDEELRKALLSAAV